MTKLETLSLSDNPKLWHGTRAACFLFCCFKIDSLAAWVPNVGVDNLRLGLENTAVGKYCHARATDDPKFALNDRAAVVEKCLCLFGVLRLRSTELPFPRVPKDIIIMLTRLLFRQELLALIPAATSTSSESKRRKFPSLLVSSTPPRISNFHSILTLH